MEDKNSFASVLRNRGFLNLWVNQILVQLAYNSLNFALIIWVFLLTNSTTAGSVLLVSIYLPAVIFGLFAGVLVDISDRRKIILAINLFLALSVFSLVYLKNVYPAILFIAFFVNTLAQFYTPAESSAIPIIVKKKQLLTANSLFSTTLFTTFLVGFGLSGAFIDYFGINYIFVFVSALLFGAFLLAFRFPSIKNKSDKGGRLLVSAIKKREYLAVKQLGGEEIGRTLLLVRGKLPVLSSIFILAGVQAVVGILAVLTPAFLERVLQISATNASYVLIVPLGLGMVIGGLLIGKIGYKFPRRKLVGAAVSVAGILLLMVGVAPLISPVIQYFPRSRPLPFFYQPPLSAILAIGSFLLGIAMVSIIIPSQTVLHENTPESDRGKVFAVLGVIMSALSLLPVMFAGILGDLFGTMPIFIVLGGTVALLGLFILKPDFFFEEKHLPYRVREFLGSGHWRK